MAKRHLLRSKNRVRRLVGDAGEGRSRTVSRNRWQVQTNNGAHNGRSAGAATAAPDVQKTPATQAREQAVATGVAGPPSEAPDQLKRPEQTSELNPECPACGSAHRRILFEATDRLYRTTNKQFSVAECKECGLIRLEPQPTKEELAGYYPDQYWFTPDGTAGRLEEAYRRVVLRDHLAFVRQALANSDGAGYVLDAGCGNGLLLSLLRGWKILGLDFSAKALSVAWKNNGVPAVCADLSEAPLLPGSCPVVTMFHVLEHLPDPVRYLEAARELLTPGGRLVVQVPNASCWQFRLFGEKWNGIDVPRHLFDYRQRDVEKLLDFCGFEVTRRKHFSVRDNPAGMASSVAPGLDPMARRVRRIQESTGVRLLKDAVYFGLVLAALPFTIFEAACGRGSTIMIEARKKA